jgi:hypothetical protein
VPPATRCVFTDHVRKPPVSCWGTSAAASQRGEGASRDLDDAGSDPRIAQGAIRGSEGPCDHEDHDPRQLEAACTRLREIVVLSMNPMIFTELVPIKNRLLPLKAHNLELWTDRSAGRAGARR